MESSEVVCGTAEKDTQGNGAAQPGKAAQGEARMPQVVQVKKSPEFGVFLDGLWLQAMHDCGVPIGDVWVGPGSR